MSIAAVLIVAVLAGVVSIWLIRTENTARDTGEDKLQDDEIQPEAWEALDGDILEENEDKPAKQKLFFLVMFAVNIALSQFRLWYYGASVISVINLLLLCAVLWPSAWIDRREFRIPNRFLLIGVIARCATLAAESLTQPTEIGYILFRCAVAAIALLLVSVICRLLIPGSIGFGDVKLLMLMGFFLGVDGIWGVMFCSMAASFIVSLYLVIAKKADRKTEIPFAPFLLIGTIAASFLMNF